MNSRLQPNLNPNNERLKIFTLGRFLVRCGENSLSEQANRSYRLWDLFKYLITYRDKDILPEVILETLWHEQEYSDPKRALRTPIYRLRQILSEGNDCCANSSFITFSQGCYKWDTSTNYWLDVEEFEVLCNEGNLLAEKNPDEAVVILRSAVSLYKGEYLPECSYHEWVSAVRNYYRRIYLQSALLLIKLLKEMGRHPEIIELCESVFLIEPFEEDFHLNFLWALLAEEKKKEARTHYEYVTSLFYRELGVKPSASMREIYRSLKNENETVELDLTVIQESLADRQDSGSAFFCDRDIFRYLYKIERRRMERSGQVVFLCLLTLATAEYMTPHQRQLKEAADMLTDQLLNSLRKGDIVTRWNDSQFLLLLPGLSLEQGEKVMQRITHEYSRKSPTDVKLYNKLQPLLPLATQLRIY